MPYIAKGIRIALYNSLGALRMDLRTLSFPKGYLNYCITELVIAYVDHHGKSYDTLSDVTGVLNDVKVEFERRRMAPYEDAKIEENGDVY